MTHYKAPLTAKFSKKNNKEVHRVEKERVKQQNDPLINALTEKELSQRFPRKKAPPRKTVHTAPTAKRKKSKRTNPGPGLNESPPAHIHREGFRWIKTLVKQCRLQTKKLQKKLSKKKR